jgi:hypothetical protein
MVGKNKSVPNMSGIRSPGKGGSYLSQQTDNSLLRAKRSSLPLVEQVSSENSHAQTPLLQAHTLAANLVYGGSRSNLSR